MKRVEPGVPYMIVGTKSDTRDMIPPAELNPVDFVLKADGAATASRLGAASFFESSSLKEPGIREIFMQELFDAATRIGLQTSLARSSKSSCRCSIQ